MVVRRPEGSGWSALIEEVWPSSCAGCGAVGCGRLCPACVPPGLHQVAHGIEGLDRVWTLGAYDAPVGRAVRRAKVHGDRGLGLAVGQALGRRVAAAACGGPFAAVVPAPSSVASRVQRGFSLASVLALGVSRHTGLPLVDALVRRGGRRQSGLDAARRRRNLRGRLRTRIDLDVPVLLVDDVLTTGATAEACVRELLGSGVPRVLLVTAAAARPPRPAPAAATPLDDRPGQPAIEG